ncbi:reverse transcriptase domain-containing protein [Tanacetum coccineum]
MSGYSSNSNRNKTLRGACYAITNTKCSESTAQVPPPEDQDSIFIEILKPKAKKTVQETNSPEPNSYQPKLPYPERMKVREKDIPSAQQSRLGALKPTPIFTRLANRFVTFPMDLRVAYDLNGRPFLRTAKALIDLYEEKLTLRVGSDELFFSVEDDELTLLDSFPPGNDDSVLKKDVHEENFQVYSNPLFEFDDNFNSSNVNPLFNEKDEDDENKNSNVSNSDEPVFLNTPLTDKVECFDPEDNIDEIDAFLAMEVSSNFEEGYYDSEGDVIFLESLLSDDTTHNLSPEVISDHEPKQNESIHNTSITFSPRSDPLHHEFVGELLTLPSRIVREHEEYLSLMTLLCEISTSRSPENVHANPSSIIESLPVSLIPVEDSEPVQEEIDLFLVPDDLIPPGVENDDSEDEDNSTFLPENELSILEPSSPRPPPEPPDVCLNFKPDTAMKKDEDFNQGEIVLSLNVKDVNPFTFVIWTFLPYFTYSEDSPFILFFGSTIFKEPPYPFDYPTRRLTMKEILDKFIDEGKQEHEEMEIFIKEFRTTNELLLKERSNLLSELKIKVNELSKVMSNVLIPKNKVKGMTTRGGKMTSEATRSKEINETRINKNEPLRFKQDVQEKPHDDGVKNKSSSISQRTTQPLNLKQLDINISFIEALVQIPKYAEYLKILLTNESRLEEGCTETMNERCSSGLLNKLPLKEKDPRSFTIPCQVLAKHKEAEDLAINHLSMFENPHMEVLTERKIIDKFSDEHLMVLKSMFKEDDPWYADFVIYIVGKIVPTNWTFKKRKRFLSQVKNYFWKEPYVLKHCTNNIMRRCVAGNETIEILALCHSGPTGRHHSANVTAKKVYESGFYWPSIFKDVNEYVRLCDTCQRSRNISARNKMTQNNIQVEAQALPTNDARVVLNELAELRDGDYKKTKIYKEWTKKWHDSRLSGDKDFKIGDKVLLYNSRLKMHPRKLNSKWNSPNIVKTKYYEGDIDKEDDEVIEFENGVTWGRRESNLKTLIKTKVLLRRQPRQFLFIFIDSVFPDINTAVSLYGVFQFMDTAYLSPVHFV